MQLALSSHSLGMSHPLEEDIRIAAITGYPWLVVARAKMESFLAQPEMDIRDLKRLFLRTQPAALDALRLPDSDPAREAEVEALCKEARRLGAPVVVARLESADERIAQLAEVAARWSCVLALAPAPDAAAFTFNDARRLVQSVGHAALGLYVEPVALWRAGETLRPDDAARTVLLAVGDVDEQGMPALPGEGVVPLAELLAPLRAGGYDSLALLALEGQDAPAAPEAFAGAGRRALREVLEAAGWSVE